MNQDNTKEKDTKTEDSICTDTKANYIKEKQLEADNLFKNRTTIPSRKDVHSFVESLITDTTEQVRTELTEEIRRDLQNERKQEVKGFVGMAEAINKII